MQTLIYLGPGVRIDKRLSTQLPYSRSFFAHLFERGGVIIKTRSPIPFHGEGESSRIVKKSYKLKDGDEVVIDNLERFVDGGILEECPAWDVDVRLEKEDYMVIYKPRGVLSHPNSVRDVQYPSVVGGVYHLIRSRSGVDLPSMGSFVRAGLVHRLDKETSGLMIIAKTEKGLDYFKKLFQQKSLAESIDQKEAVPLKKYYIATAHVTPQGQEFLDSISEFPYYIIQDVIPQVPYPTIKEGITKIVSRSKTNQECQVLFDIEILTGRTHQIRYHLSSQGLPIVGDYVYGDEDDTYMHLDAYRLVFEDPQGEMVDLKL